MAKPEQKLDPKQPYPGIPDEKDFEEEGEDFLEAEDLAEIGLRVIRERNLEHLKGLPIAFFWKKKGGARHGRPILGTCQKPSGLLAHYCTASFIVLVAADHARSYQLTRFQMEALLFHELSHTDVDEGKPILVSHDCEVFVRELEYYGPWKNDLQRMTESIKQMKLL